MRSSSNHPPSSAARRPAWQVPKPVRVHSRILAWAIASSLRQSPTPRTSSSDHPTDGDDKSQQKQTGTERNGDSGDDPPYLQEQTGFIHGTIVAQRPITRLARKWPVASAEEGDEFRSSSFGVIKGCWRGRRTPHRPAANTQPEGICCL
jgi:hypothetical protein